MLSKTCAIIIDCGVSAPRYRREVVDGLNTTKKTFPLKLMANVQLSVSKGYDTQMEIHYATHKYDVSLAQEFQKHLPNTSCKMY